jgi:hypothetical protein
MEKTIGLISSVVQKVGGIIFFVNKYQNTPALQNS